MWQQTLFSKKNRSLITGSQFQDEFHVLSDKTASAFDKLRPIANSTSARSEPILLFMKRTGNDVLIGVSGLIGEVLGASHEFAREVNEDTGRSTGRKITFDHAYHQKFGPDTRIPSIEELLVRQKDDLSSILTQAHNGIEPVPVPEVNFSTRPSATSAWHEMASKIEGGKTVGGLFSPDGQLVKELQIEIAEPTKAAQKKTSFVLQETSRATHSASSNRKLSPIFWTVTAVTCGVGVGLWAWNIHQQKSKNHGGQDASSLIR